MKGEDGWTMESASGSGSITSYVLSEGKYYLGTDITVDKNIKITGAVISQETATKTPPQNIIPTAVLV